MVDVSLNYLKYFSLLFFSVFSFSISFAQQDHIDRLKYLLEEAENDSSKVDILNQLHIEYLDISQSTALNYGKQALKLAQEVSYQRGVYNSANHLGNLYEKQGAFDKAKNNYLIAAEAEKKINAKKELATTYNSLGNVEAQLNNDNVALNYYLDALAIRREINDQDGIAISLANLGSFYYQRENYGKALNYYNEALDAARESKIKKTEAYILYQLGVTHDKLNKTNEAIAYFEEQLKIAQAISDKDQIQRAYKALSQMHAKLKNYEKAYEYYRLYVTESDATFQEGLEARDKEIEEIERKKQQKEREFNLQQKIIQEEEQLNRLIQIIFAGILIFVIVIALILYRSNHNNIKKNQLLAQQKNEIESKNKEILKKNNDIEKAFVEIEQKNQDVQIAFEEIERKNKDITASINYAKRIQNAMLPPQEAIKAEIPDYFILFRARDIVSGDFYFFSKLEDEKVIIAAIDCTGHGVPGAFMSMVGNDYLNQIINQQQETSPDVILQKLHESIVNNFRQRETENRDGMDAALCVIDKKTKTLEFAGASRPIIYIFQHELQDIQSSRLPVGGYQNDAERFFEKQSFPICQDEPSMFYIFSDGYQDQFGGPKGRKFAKKKLIKLLHEIHQKPLTEQKEILEKTLEDWMGDSRQMDDILVIGFRL